MINDYIARIVRIFAWGVEEELTEPNTAAALKAVKSLQSGHIGTFDNEEREHVPDEVIRRTLPFMPPTIAAMVQIQRLTGLRPGEVFNMTVAEIDKDADPELWLYRLNHHKTEKKIQRKKIIPLSKIEQELIAPYLVGKQSEQAVFSPQTAMEERNAEKRANRKTKITPSQAARNATRAVKPKLFKEFYNKDSYRQAVEYAINKGNKTLPDGEKIPYWTPYQIRHTSATAMELSDGLEASQALLERPVAIEKRYEVPLITPQGEDLGIPLVGIVDLIIENEHGHIIVDFKTSATSSICEMQHELQLTAYSYLFHSIMDEHELHSEIRQLIKTKIPKVQCTRFPRRSKEHINRFFDLIREYLDALDKGVYNYRPAWTCSMCDHYGTCC